MFQVALCEDEKIFAETQAQLCREILGRMNIEYELTVFADSRDFLAAFTAVGRRYDLILLDIVMAGLNGMELAGKIRETDRAAELVFITASREYAIDGYEVGALHYLVKPVDAALLERLIKTVYENKYQTAYFLLKSGTQNQRIAVKDIIILETAGRKVAVTTTDGQYYYSGKLTQLLAELPQGCFRRCHQAYAVNLDHLRELDRSWAVAMNGSRIPVSRPYLKTIRTAFLMNMQEK